MSKIVVAGSLNMDLIIRADHLPRTGETIIGSDLKTAAGGKGANQAVAAARLGGQVSMVGRVGKDNFGDLQVKGLQADGIDTRHISLDPTAPTGVAMILLDAGAQNMIVVSPGANHRLAPLLVEAAGEAIAAADILVLQLEIPLETVIQAANLARAHGVKVLLNPAPARPLPDALLACIDFLILNETEAEILTGINIKTQQAREAAAKKLLELGVETIVITLGEHGALAITNKHMFSTPAFPVQAVDTTAAGDAFVGAFAVAISSGHSLEQSVRFACAAGALTTTGLGAQPSLPQLTTLKTFLGE
ncbi:MAG: ribokinase [Chloroflexota bacterium]